MSKISLVYYSATGNTEKMALIEISSINTIYYTT